MQILVYQIKEVFRSWEYARKWDVDCGAAAVVADDDAADGADAWAASDGIRKHFYFGKWGHYSFAYLGYASKPTSEEAAFFFS